MNFSNGLRIFLLFICVLAILIGILFSSGAFRNDLEVSEMTIELSDLPEAWDGVKIAHVSDLHGNNPKGMMEAIENDHPDLIFATGDVYDGVQHADTTNKVLSSLSKIAPVYMVSGNHEYYSGQWKKRAANLDQLGITLLDHDVMTLYKEGQPLEIAGIQDPDFHYRWSFDRRLEQLNEDVGKLPEKKACRLLLFHRADLFDYLEKTQADLVFSGHIHGGHIRLFGKGFLQPNDGNGSRFFPKYDSGLFEQPDGMKMIESRGLGDQMIIPRLYNRPQLLLITLRRAPEKK